MSDLIIKPSGTSANFKVQNPSGTNKITMDSDGVTTFTSNVSLSGTMTAGTLGSGVTFPAGIMIYIGETRVTSVGTTSTSLSFIKTGIGTSSRDLDITVAAATVAKFSKIYVHASTNIYINSGSAFTLADFKIRRENSNGDSDLGSTGQIIGKANATGGFVDLVNLLEVDTSLPTSGDVTYSVMFRKHKGVDAYSGAIAPLGSETYTTGIIVAWGIV